MKLIGPTHSVKFMKKHNSGITTLKHAICDPKVFQKLPENQLANNFIYLIFTIFVT